LGFVPLLTEPRFRGRVRPEGGWWLARSSTIGRCCCWSDAGRAILEHLGLPTEPPPPGAVGPPEQVFDDA
jgi:hypothetical protein